MNASAQTPTDEPRLSLIDKPSDPEIAAMFETVYSRTGRLLNLHRMMGYAPSLALASLEMALAFRQGARLPRTLVELIILRTAQSLASKYELHQHLPMALANGVSQLRIDALPRWSESSLFAAAERAALAFCDGVLGKAEIDDQSFADLRRHFSPREIVELAMLVSQYVATAYFVRALRVPLEAARGSAAATAGENEMPKTSGIRTAPKRVIEAGRTTVEGVGALAEATALSAAKAATGALLRTVRKAQELVERQNDKQRASRKAKRKKASVGKKTATKTARKRTAKPRVAAKAAKTRKSAVKTTRRMPAKRRTPVRRRRSA